ncbi:hypothetical protein MYCTH_2130131 [Thermothelomyces thermophilus ATCC 42464]|uniref:Uncharacterized protein n=1 Tax=Thermothelomyces thermophilus (strain ATCC 42464 / BCRC 31852 / DSM 1799) TaxID=573729 RepID=G2QM02_THET4|nr:uncharacterized protein MYCTH_2130131 [Thermothelomyces thermophilus ATCC 42464]AEO60982.1 hypothetical protein MYCTH_2130131 [Thermothelomyces thermophilus ATCC 42464]
MDMDKPTETIAFDFDPMDIDKPTVAAPIDFDPMDIDEPTAAAAVDFDPMEIDGPAELNTDRTRSGKNAFGCHSESINHQDTKGCPTSPDLDKVEVYSLEQIARDYPPLSSDESSSDGIDEDSGGSSGNGSGDGMDEDSGSGDGSGDCMDEDSSGGSGDSSGDGPSPGLVSDSTSITTRLT